MKNSYLIFLFCISISNLFSNMPENLVRMNLGLVKEIKGSSTIYDTISILEKYKNIGTEEHARHYKIYRLGYPEEARKGIDEYYFKAIKKINMCLLMCYRSLSKLEKSIITLEDFKKNLTITLSKGLECYLETISEGNSEDIQVVPIIAPIKGKAPIVEPEPLEPLTDKTPLPFVNKSKDVKSSKVPKPLGSLPSKHRLGSSRKNIQPAHRFQPLNPEGMAGNKSWS